MASCWSSMATSSSFNVSMSTLIEPGKLRCDVIIAIAVLHQEADGKPDLVALDKSALGTFIMRNLHGFNVSDRSVQIFEPERIRALWRTRNWENRKLSGKVRRCGPIRITCLNYGGGAQKCNRGCGQDLPRKKNGRPLGHPLEICELPPGSTVRRVAGLPRAVIRLEGVVRRGGTTGRRLKHQSTCDWLMRPGRTEGWGTAPPMIAPAINAAGGNQKPSC